MKSPRSRYKDSPMMLTGMSSVSAVLSPVGKPDPHNVPGNLNYFVEANSSVPYLSRFVLSARSAISIPEGCDLDRNDSSRVRLVS